MFKKLSAMLSLIIGLALLAAGITGLAAAQSTADNVPADETLTPVGKLLYFDENLSVNGMQACATCHDPAWGFTGPVSEINAHGAVYPGAIPTRFGNRKPPTAAYGGYSPVLYYNEDDEVWIGGMFWDGRATGWILGDPLAEQAKGPFLNPVEQGMPNAQLLCFKVALAEYAYMFAEAWGLNKIKCAREADFLANYERIARAIAAFERSDEVNPFSSKFDAFWDQASAAGQDVAAIDLGNYEGYYGFELTDDEVLGLALFNDKGKCALCHLLEIEYDAPRPLFTDYTYDNLGIPKNPENPFYTMPPAINPDGVNWTDYGLGGFLESAGYSNEVYTAQYGKHKVPTLRNVDLRPSEMDVKAYGHNGFFTSLEEIVHFYNTRDVPSEGWPPPEIPGTVNTEELGNLGLTEAEEALIVLFMQTLSDGYVEQP